jgi:hypothetical protein
MFDHAQYASAFQIAAVFPIAGYMLWRALSAIAPATE